MKPAQGLLLLILLLAALPFTFIAKTDASGSDPFKYARYYDSLAMPDSALFWLDKISTTELTAESRLRYFLLRAGQLRQINRTEDAWAYNDSIQKILPNYSPSPGLSAEILFLAGRLLNDRGDYLAAIQSFDSAENLLNRSSGYDTGLLIRILNFKSISKYYLGEFNASAEDLKKADILAKNSDRINPLDYSDVLQNLAIVYSNMSLFDSAYHYIVKARSMKEKVLKKDDPLLISFYINYGRFLQMTGRIDESLFYFNYADNLLKDKSGLDFVTGSLHINLGNAYQLTGDYERAIQYFQSAYGYLSQSQGLNHPNTITALNNLALMYSRTSQTDSAFSILNRLLTSQLTPVAKIRVYRNLSTTYRSLRQFENAKKSVLKSISTAAEFLGERHYEYAYSVFEKARIDLAMNDFSSALSSITEVETAYGTIFPATDEEYINILRIKAFIYSRLLKFPEAEQIFDRADSLLMLLNAAEGQQLSGVPRYLSFRNANLLIDKARMYQEWYDLTGNIEKLEQSVDLYGRSLVIYEQYSQFASEESRLFMGEDMRGTYEDALRAAWDLYSLKGGQHNLDLAFGFSSRAKSSVLLSSIRKLQAFDAAGVPPQTIESERKLRLEIHALTRAASEERMKIKPNISRIAFLDAKRVGLTRAYDSLIQEIEINYPDYYALRYAPAILTIRQVQQNLSPDQAMIEYFIENDHLYLFAVRRDSLMVMRHALPENLETDVEKLRSILLGNLMYHGIEDYQRFLDISTTLYKELIEPIEGFIVNKRLVIVPDGVLGYLPFDLLIEPERLTDDHRNNLNYAELPMMLRDFPLSYLSSSALTKSFGSSSGRKSGRLLAMAPDYNQEAGGGSEKLSPLPFALKEAETVRKIWGGVLLAGSNATKRAFIETAPRFGLIHLAMHTLLDDENPLYSKLVFHQEDTASSAIFGYELYALRFKAAIVVLSACNSGIGKLRSAEGVMSLSRAFMYAGTPSVVMTGWEINDQSGSRLMELFYSNLADGLSKDRALQQAKLSWLSESNKLKSHPFFWAAYQMLGDTQPLKKGISNLVLAGVLMSLILLTTVFVIVTKRRNVKFAAKA